MVSTLSRIADILTEDIHTHILVLDAGAQAERPEITILRIVGIGG